MIEQVNPDKAPAEDSEEEEKPKVLDSWGSFFKPKQLGTVLHKKLYVAAPIIGLYYIINFMCCVSACNFYSDISRLDTCVSAEGVASEKESASAILDGAILLGGIFHIIEWVKTTILLTVVLIGAVNLMWAWYALKLNTIFGIVTLVFVHLAYFGKGKDCMDSQPTRYTWLMIEVIYFWALFWFFQYPFWVLFCCKQEAVHDAINAKDDDEDED